jgi:D-threo-aldose 1-dehydrogenase
MTAPTTAGPTRGAAADQVGVGRTSVRVSRLGIGAGTQAAGAGAAGLHSMLSRAWEVGLRYVDTAPLYLAGGSERGVGDFVHEDGRSDVVVSTKVGRLPDQPGAAAFSGARRFDYTERGTRASLEGSLARLGRDRLDLVVVHDLDRLMHGEGFEQAYATAVDECFPVLAEYRRDGRVGAIGVSTRQSDVALRALGDMELDCVMMAGSYTLLDHGPAHELLPRCRRDQVSVIIASPFNTGILATGSPESMYDYAPPPPPVVDRVAALVAVGDRYGVPLAAAALQFPLRHSAVVSVVGGHRIAEEVDRNVAGMDLSIPAEYWAELQDLGLVPVADSPRPAST